MPAESQVRLLRVLESGELTRVGGEAPLDVDVRVVAATNRSPRAAIDEGKLREDLYYRLNVLSIDLPPLRNRGEDIGLLVQHVLHELNEKGAADKRIDPSALDALADYSWPGNVRELRNVVRSAFIMADETIDVDDLPQEITGDRPAGRGAAPELAAAGATLADVEKKLILATLDECDGNRTRTAEALGISVKTLYNRLKAYDEQEG